MANINDLGLPQGLPEMLGGHRACTQYSPSCPCSACQQLRAFSGSTSGSACFCSGKCRELGYCPNASGTSAPVRWPTFTRDLERSRPAPTRPREMTAADLGLPEPDFLPTSFNREDYDDIDSWSENDAPYSFWLGADA